MSLFIQLEPRAPLGGAEEKRREKGGGLMKQHAFGELETRQST